MAVELMMNCTNNTFVSQSSEERAAAEAAASGLQSVEKLIRLFSNSHHQSPPSPPEETDYVAVADVAVNKFKRVISLLGRTRTGHARFRRAPVSTSPASSSSSPSSRVITDYILAPSDQESTKIYCPTPIQQIPPPDYHHKTISFSNSPAISLANSFLSSGDTDQSKQQPSSSSAFQIISNLSHSGAGGKPPLSSCSSFKRKCAASGKCSGSSSRCHCSKRRSMVNKYINHTRQLYMTSIKYIDLKFIYIYAGN